MEFRSHKKDDRLKLVNNNIIQGEGLVACVGLLEFCPF